MSEHEVIIATGTADKHDMDKPDRVNVELTLAARCQILEAENAALKAELDAEKLRHANNHAAWTATNTELRDAHQRALDERDAYRSQFWDNALPELTEMRKQREAARDAFVELKAELAAARQSRARLVRLVRALNHEGRWTQAERAEFRAAIEGVQIQHLLEQLRAARAWAAAWKAAAKIRRNNA